MSTAIAEAIRSKRVLICVGAGGVGKTTVSATLALRAATLGRSSLVCTIDPARRLANSLGLAELGNSEREISISKLAASGIDVRAPMRAMMLDMKQSWDELIRTYAPADQLDRIMNNRFYQSMSTSLAGSQEYIAMEKLWELRNRRDYGVIVLDTPPTAHALDFLEAPNRMLDFLDNEAAKWLLNPAMKAGRIGFKLFSFGGSYLAKTIGRLTGAETLQELGNFLMAVSDMNQGFRERARSVRELLGHPDTGFVIVTAPTGQRMDEAVRFHQLLRENRMNPVAVVVNRVHPMPGVQARVEAEGLPAALRHKVLTTLDEQERLARADADGIAQLAHAIGQTPMIRIPRFDLDVHDLQGLWNTSKYLLGEERLEAAAAA